MTSLSLSWAGGGVRTLLTEGLSSSRLCGASPAMDSDTCRLYDWWNLKRANRRRKELPGVRERHVGEELIGIWANGEYYEGPRRSRRVVE